MPKIAPIYSIINYQLLQKKIKYYQDRYNMSDDALAAAMRISMSTLRRRRQNPEEYTLAELGKLAHKCHTTVIDLLDPRQIIAIVPMEDLKNEKIQNTGI